MRKKNKITLFLLSLIIYSCVSSDTINFELKLKSEMDSIQNDLYRSIKVLKSESNDILIEIVFNHKKVVHKDHQQIIIYYVLSRIDDLDKFKSFKIKHHAEGEVLKNRYEINMNQNELENILNEYNGIFESMLLKCLKEFDSTTIFTLEAAINNVNRRYPDDTLGGGFANLLFQFSRECSKKVKTKDAMSTIVTMFVAVRTFNDSESNTLGEMDDTLKLLNDLWEICKKEHIEEAENRLFGKKNNIW